MKRRAQHSEITPEMSERIEELLRQDIVKALGCADSRIKRSEIFDPGLEGRSGMHIHAEPPLTEAEARVVDKFLARISAEGGCRPPIRVGIA